MTKEVAALYLDRRGPYWSIPEVDCWDVDRDADTYAGPLPVVAHPPCGPWGKLAHWYKGGEGHKQSAIHAVGFVRKFGGVLEHPVGSQLWKAAGLPLPGQPRDEFGGYTVQVSQVHWGHTCIKPTLLYCVGAEWDPVYMDETREHTHQISYPPRGSTRWKNTRHLKTASEKMRKVTPKAFADELVRFAKMTKGGLK